MAEQHSLTADYETPYKFNGKELDSETGLYYYGARYYDPRTSIWLSTDPLMEMYPNVNPYVYCVQNPIKYIDPDGKRIRNGDTERIKHRQKDLADKEKIVAGAEKTYGTKSEGFQNKRRYKKYLEIKKEISELRAEIINLEERAKLTDKRIQEFKDGAPDQFEIMDNITNEYCEVVDVYVGIDPKMPAGTWGLTEANFDVNSLEVRPRSEEFGINTISVLLAEKNEYGFNDTTPPPSFLTATKHEMGHGNYIIEQAASYIKYIKYLKENNINPAGGHNHSNPSGKRADEWQ